MCLFQLPVISSERSIFCFGQLRRHTCLSRFCLWSHLLPLGRHCFKLTSQGFFCHSISCILLPVIFLQLFLCYQKWHNLYASICVLLSFYHQLCASSYKGSFCYIVRWSQLCISSLLWWKYTQPCTTWYFGNIHNSQYLSIYLLLLFHLLRFTNKPPFQKKVVYIALKRRYISTWLSTSQVVRAMCTITSATGFQLHSELCIVHIVYVSATGAAPCLSCPVPALLSQPPDKLLVLQCY